MKILARAVGRRKEAIAQVKLVEGTGDFVINDKPAQEYLHYNSRSILAIKSPFEVIQNVNQDLKIEQVDAIIKVQGGGLMGQTEAIKLAVARAVSLFSNSDDSIRKSLKENSLLTQDSRVKERRKYGLRKARKAPSYSKR